MADELGPSSQLEAQRQLAVNLVRLEQWLGMAVYARTSSLTKRLRAAATWTSGSPNKMVTERNGLDSWVRILGLYTQGTKKVRLKIFTRSVWRRIRQSRSGVPLGALKGVNGGPSGVRADDASTVPRSPDACVRRREPPTSSVDARDSKKISCFHEQCFI